MIKQKVLAAYEDLADSYSQLIEHKPHNAYYDRPNTLSLFPDNLRGKQILDAGCGPGKYAELLLAKGASVTGLDLSPNMIAEAKKRNGDNGIFFVHDLTEPLPQFEQSSFDIVLSALAFDYVEDWNPIVKEFCRLLKPDGHLIVSLTHPFFDYHFYNAKNYFTTENVSCVWNGFGKPTEIHSYRRSLMEVMQSFTENGFYIDKLLEPRPVPEFEKFDKRHFKELNEFPSFLCIRAVKR